MPKGKILPIAESKQLRDSEKTKQNIENALNDDDGKAVLSVNECFLKVMGSVSGNGDAASAAAMAAAAEAPLLAAPHFYWGCCMVCRLAGTSERPLKRCSRCAAVFYCSSEHQKRHWKLHRRLCSYLSTAAEEIGADNFFGKG